MVREQAEREGEREREDADGALESCLWRPDPRGGAQQVVRRTVLDPDPDPNPAPATKDDDDPEGERSRPRKRARLFLLRGPDPEKPSYDQDPSPQRVAKRKPTELVDYLQRRLDITRPYCGTKLTTDQYHSTQRVCYLPDAEIGLFKRYDPELRKTVHSWDRCQYTLARKVKIECEHRAGCNGFKGSGPTLMGRLLMVCDCPQRTILNNYVWLVDPREKQVDRVDEDGNVFRVVHGQEHGPVIIEKEEK